MITLRPWKPQKFKRRSQSFWYCTKCFAGPLTGKGITKHRAECGKGKPAKQEP